MTTSESKGRFFTNETNRIDSNRELECSTNKAVIAIRPPWVRYYRLLDQFEYLSLCAVPSLKSLSIRLFTRAAVRLKFLIAINLAIKKN